MKRVVARRFPLAIVLLVAASIAPACSTDDEPQRDIGDASAEMSHVHGIAPGPAGGALIATHDGLYRVNPKAGSPELVGDNRHDLMGFTRAGRDRYVASGHPDPRDTRMPPNLGVIESRDQGRTWNGIAFYGEADFHVLEAQGDSIYGYDGHGGRLRASTGGPQWREHVPPDEILSLAISPRSPKQLIAASPSGLSASITGGAKWRPLRPDITGMLTWPATDRLFLVDPAGTVHLSRDGGGAWKQVGRLGGAPTAFEAVGADLYAALQDGSVRRSSDAGATWSVVATL